VSILLKFVGDNEKLRQEKNIDKLKEKDKQKEEKKVHPFMMNKKLNLQTDQQSLDINLSGKNGSNN
jgi:hypothetical protein